MNYASKQQNESVSKEKVKRRFNEISLFKINKKNSKTTMFTANIGPTRECFHDFSWFL